MRTFLLVALCFVAKGDDMAYMINAQSQFGVIDLNSGNFSPVGNSSVAPYVPVGLGVAGAKLYTAGYTDTTLYQINPANGSLTKIGSGSVHYYGLGSTTAGLYALGTYTGVNNVPLFNLYSVDPTSGATTLIGPLGAVGPAAVSSLSTGSSTLYLVENFNLYSVDTSSGAATLIGSQPLMGLNAAALVYEHGTLYAGVNSCTSSCNLSTWSLNTTTGAGTQIASATNTGNFQGLAPIVPPTTQQFLGQFAFGGGWYTAVYFTNTTTSAVSFTVNFIADDGNVMNLPVIGRSTMVSLAAGGTAIVEAPNFGSLQQGYASAALPTGVTGYGVFRQSVTGIPDQEAVVPLTGEGVSGCTLVWDDTAYTTAIAVANPSSSPANVSITIRDSSGSVIGTSSLTLAPRTKTEAVLRNLPGLGGVVGNRGSASFATNGGNIVVLGLRFNGAAFTSIPVTNQ